MGSLLYASRKRRRGVWITIMVGFLLFAGIGLGAGLNPNEGTSDASRYGLIAFGAVSAIAAPACLVMAVRTQEKSKKLRELEALPPTVSHFTSWHIRSHRQSGRTFYYYTVVAHSDQHIYVLNNIIQDALAAVISAQESGQLINMIEGGYAKYLLKKIHKFQPSQVQSVEAQRAKVLIDTGGETTNLTIGNLNKEVATHIAGLAMPGVTGVLIADANSENRGKVAGMLNPDAERLVFSYTGVTP